MNFEQNVSDSIIPKIILFYIYTRSRLEIANSCIGLGKAKVVEEYQTHGNIVGEGTFPYPHEFTEAEKYVDKAEEIFKVALGEDHAHVAECKKIRQNLEEDKKMVFAYRMEKNNEWMSKFDPKTAKMQRDFYGLFGQLTEQKEKGEISQDDLQNGIKDGLESIKKENCNVQ